MAAWSLLQSVRSPSTPSCSTVGRSSPRNVQPSHSSTNSSMRVRRARTSPTRSFTRILANSDPTSCWQSCFLSLLPFLLSFVVSFPIFTNFYSDCTHLLFHLRRPLCVIYFFLLCVAYFFDSLLSEVHPFQILYISPLLLAHEL